ncbi:MAG TPA: hypothetical protein PKD90_19960, partial [Phnomibacter sp.]|nr:hypothetical protein [Phnomibacter sp.]
NDMEFFLDLGQQTAFHKVGLHFLQVANHLVFLPETVNFYTSDDGEHYQQIATVTNPTPFTKESKTNDIQLFATEHATYNARYIKVIAQNMKTAPYWHHGTGLGAWIFADEIVVTP